MFRLSVLLVIAVAVQVSQSANTQNSCVKYTLPVNNGHQVCGTYVWKNMDIPKKTCHIYQQTCATAVGGPYKHCVTRSKAKIDERIASTIRGLNPTNVCYISESISNHRTKEPCISLVTRCFKREQLSTSRRHRRSIGDWFGGGERGRKADEIIGLGDMVHQNVNDWKTRLASFTRSRRSVEDIDEDTIEHEDVEDISDQEKDSDSVVED